jgi:uncharacterized YigZ family protein
MSHTLLQPASIEAVIKRSRFIAHAAPCTGEDQAREFLTSINDPTASHHCWAWLSGQQYRFDDDGEPGGTAGRPILQAIEGQNLDRVMVVVIRHFGGVKLGTGGLARAYGGTASACLRDAETAPIIPMTSLNCRVPFESIANVHLLLERHQADKHSEHFTPDGIDLVIELPQSNRATLITDLRNATSGQLRIDEPDNPD